MQQRFRHSEAAEQCQIEWGKDYPFENWKTDEYTNNLAWKIDEAEKQVLTSLAMAKKAIKLINWNSCRARFSSEKSTLFVL